MTRPARVLLWLTAVFSALLLLSFAVFAVLPRVINSEWARSAVQARLSEQIGAQISYRGADLFLFPRPGVVFHDGTATFRDRMQGAFDSLEVQMKVLPLLRGSAVLSSVRLISPKVSIRLEESPTDKRFPTLEELRGKLRRLFKTLAGTAPNLSIVMEKGSLTFNKGDGTVFSFSDLGADVVFPPEEPQIRVTGSSGFAHSIKIQFRMEQESLSGKGEIELGEVRLKPFAGYFMPHELLEVDGPPTDLRLRFTIHGMKTIEGETSCGLSSLTLTRKGRRLSIRGDTIRGAFRISDERIEATLRELRLYDPQLILAGTLLVDRSGRQISFKLEGNGIDLPSTRRAAYSVAGDIPIVKNIFGYVKAGTVPRVTVSAEAGSFAELGNTENIRISGRIENGEVFIKGVSFDFKGVYGDCVISNGMLDATRINGQLEKIRLRNGKVRVGLQGAVVPLRIDTRVEADMGSVQDILMRLVKNEDAVREISFFSNVEGKAAGRLILGGKSDAPDVTADIKEVSVSADYVRAPYPLRILGGGIFFDGRQARTNNLRIAFGKSSFSGLTASLELEKNHAIHIASGSLTISIPEIHRWLGSYDALKSALGQIAPMEGTVSLSSLALNGPILSPKEWRFRTRGSCRDIAFTAPDLPGSVAIAKANIEATEERVAVSGAEIRMLDSAVEFSGDLSGYMNRLGKLDLTLKGLVGPESFGWISGALKFPPWIRKSVRLSVSRSHLLWESGGTTSLSGIMTVSGGPEVSLDIVSGGKEFRVNRLLLEDSSSRALVSFSLDDSKVGLGFSGTLTEKTAQSLMEIEGDARGSMSGDFRGEVFRDRPMKFTGHGKMSAEGFVIPWKETEPVEIVRLSAEADGDRVRLNSCDLKWGDDEVSLRGDLTSSRKGIVVDMDASAAVIDADSIAKKVEKAGDEKAKQGRREIPFPSAEGTVRLRAGQFRYGKIGLAPFSADISLGGQGLSIGVREADFCGISLPGKVDISRGETSIDLLPSAKDESVESTISCLSRSFDLGDYATGTFDLSGNITGRGGQKDGLRSISGDIDFTARDGLIYNEPSIVRILAFLEVSQIIRGYGDIRRKGLAYDKVTVKGALRNNRIEIEEGIIDGPYIKMASQGYVDLEAGRLDVKVLVSLVRSVDRVIEKIPGVRSLLGGTLLSIPVRVTGNVKDPQVNAFALSSADSGLLGIMTNTLHLPFKVFTPLLPEKKDGKEKEGGAQGEDGR